LTPYCASESWEILRLFRIDPHYTQSMELFSLWLVSGIILDVVRECQTVFISKSALPEPELYQ